MYEKIRELRNERLYEDGEPPLEKDCEILTNQSAGKKAHNQINGIVYHVYNEEEISAMVYHRTEDANHLTNWRDSPVSEKRRFNIKKNFVVNLGLPVTLQDILRLIQLKTQSDKKDCVNYHTNKYMQLSLDLRDVSDKVGFIDIDLTKPIKEQKCLGEIYNLIK